MFEQNRRGKNTDKRKENFLFGTYVVKNFSAEKNHRSKREKENEKWKKKGLNS